MKLPRPGERLQPRRSLRCQRFPFPLCDIPWRAGFKDAFPPALPWEGVSETVITGAVFKALVPPAEHAALTGETHTRKHRGDKTWPATSRSVSSLSIPFVRDNVQMRRSEQSDVEEGTDLSLCRKMPGHSCQ